MITETSPILGLLFAKGLGPRTLSQIVDRIVQDDISVDELAHLAPAALAEQLGLRPDLAESIHNSQEQAARVARELDEQAVRLLIRGIEPYPRKLIVALGSDAPAVLFAK